MIKVLNKEGKEVFVTEKAYRILYKNRGYKRIEDNIDEKIVNESKDEDLSYEDYKKDDLIKLIEDRGLSFKSNDTKAELIEILTIDDAE